MEARIQKAINRMIDQYRDDVDELAENYENSYCNRFCPYCRRNDLDYHCPAETDDDEIDENICHEVIFKHFLEDVDD